MSRIPDEEFKILLTNAKGRLENRINKSKMLSSENKSMRFKRGVNQTAVAAKDMSGDEFRITWLLNNVPTGHLLCKTLYDAIYTALEAGYSPCVS